MAKASKTPKTLRTYAGPVYHRGIQLPGEQGLVRPAHMTPEEVTDFLVNHPEYSTWWTTPSATDDTEAGTDRIVVDTVFGQMSVSKELINLVQNSSTDESGND